MTITLFWSMVFVFFPCEGVVISRVEPCAPQAESQLQTGDVIREWRAAGQSGKVCNLLNWYWLRTERGSGNLVTLKLERSGAEVHHVMAPDAWKDVTGEPVPSESIIALKKAFRSENIEAGTRLANRLFEELEESDFVQAFGLLMQTAELLDQCGEISASQEWLRKTSDFAARHSSPLGKIIALEKLGQSLQKTDAWSAAQMVFGEMAREAGSWRPVSLFHLSALEKQAALARKNSDHLLELDLCQKALAVREAIAPESMLVVDGYVHCGAASDFLDDYEKSKEFYGRALDVVRNLEGNHETQIVSMLLKLSYASLGQMDLAESKKTLAEAIEIQESLDPDAPMMASLLINMGNVAFSLDGPGAARELFERAAVVYDRIRPISFENATVLNNLGVVSGFLGAFDDEEMYLKKSLDIREKLDPRHRDVPQSLLNLGSVAWRHGKLGAAQDYFHRARERLLEIAPNSRELTFCLSSLGTLAQERGFFARAETHFQHALNRSEFYTPDTLDHAARLSDLGHLAFLRNDFDRAWDYLNRALTIREKQAPGGLDLVYSFQHLGQVTEAVHDLEKAWEYFENSKRIREKLAPESREMAMSLCDLARIARKRGNLDISLTLNRDALSIFQKLGPDSLHVADTLVELAQSHMELGAYEKAESLLLDSLKIYSTWAQGSFRIAQVHHFLAKTHVSRGDFKNAMEEYAKAVDTLENQRSHVGGTQEAQATFRASTKDIYQETIEILVAQGHWEEGFSVYEKYRARILLDMMAQRDLRSKDLKHDQERQKLEYLYDATLKELWNLSPTSELEKMQKARAALRHIREQLAQLNPGMGTMENRRISSGFAGEELASALEDGTMVLAFSVGESRTVIFVAGPGDSDLQVTSIPLGKTDLRTLVQNFRTGIRARYPATNSQSRALSQTLLSPIKKRIQSAKRLLVLPDGPLHFLPFAALLDPLSSDADPAYLIQRLPIVYSLSLTFSHEMKDRRRHGRDWQIAAFGDPNYPPVEASEEILDQLGFRSILRGKFQLTPLPMTRVEVNEIGALFKNRCAKFLGTDATEEQAKELPGDVNLIHFACHAMIDESSPLDSALALSLPPQDETAGENGFLQAWEIFEEMRIDTDLVTLSACSTGVGRSLGGEGLMGLTRAFFHAGTRSVLATLWRISDASTPMLMGEFYRNLESGIHMDEALQRAQIAFIENDAKRPPDGNMAQDYSLPFFWAAFVLNGDWR